MEENLAKELLTNEFSTLTVVLGPGKRSLESDFLSAYCSRSVAACFVEVAMSGRF